MKALYFEEHGELDVIQYGDVPEPEPGPGQIKMRVRATALNYMDIWVRPSFENARAVMRALKRFGAPLHNLTEEDLQKADTIFQIGVAPRRIDILTGVTGLRFEEAYLRSMTVNVEGIQVRVPSLEDLIRNKRATARPKDLADAETLESLKQVPPSTAPDSQ